MRSARSAAKQFLANGQYLALFVPWIDVAQMKQKRSYYRNCVVKLQGFLRVSQVFRSSPQQRCSRHLETCHFSGT